MVKESPLTVYVVPFDAGQEIVLALVEAAAVGEAASFAKMLEGGP